MKLVIIHFIYRLKRQLTAQAFFTICLVSHSLIILGLRNKKVIEKCEKCVRVMLQNSMWTHSLIFGAKHWHCYCGHQNWTLTVLQLSMSEWDHQQWCSNWEKKEKKKTRLRIKQMGKNTLTDKEHFVKQHCGCYTYKKTKKIWSSHVKSIIFLKWHKICLVMKKTVLLQQNKSFIFMRDCQNFHDMFYSYTLFALNCIQ